MQEILKELKESRFEIANEKLFLILDHLYKTIQLLKVIILK